MKVKKYTALAVYLFLFILFFVLTLIILSGKVFAKYDNGLENNTTISVSDNSVLTDRTIETPTEVSTQLTKGPNYADVELDHQTQTLLFQACNETGCPYELALAVIWKETRYQNVNGDNGNSIGYMQIQPRWHYDRMKKLGVSDLEDPFSNFRVGCDFLAELLEKYTVEEALTCYNTGKPGSSQYSNSVMNYIEDNLTA